MLTVSIAIMNPDLVMFENMLSSLKKYTPELSQLIIIDNGSTNCLYEVTINKFFKDYELIKLDKNYGYGYAHNIAFNQCKNKYFAVLNDDIEFFEIWSTPMLELLQSNVDIIQVGPKTGVGNVWDINLKAHHINTDNPDYIEGSCFIIRKDWVNEDYKFAYKLFNEHDYKFGYFEDGDLSLRIKEEGYKIAAVDIKWKHYRAKTVDRIKDDIAGYKVNNERNFKYRWNSYIYDKKFGKTALVKRTASIGDVFLTIPILEKLKEKYATILYMTKCKQLIENVPYISAFIDYDKPCPCDTFIDLDYAYEKNGSEHIIKSYAKVAEVEVVKIVSKLFLPKNLIADCNKILLNIDDFIVVDLSTTWKAKQWSINNYILLNRKLLDMGFKIVCIGANIDSKILSVPCTLNLVNKLDVQHTAGITSMARIFIGHEGLMAHVAQAVNIKAIVLYGCTHPDYLSNYKSDKLYTVISPVACIGCRHMDMPFTGTSIICNRDYECMKRIEVDDVLSACHKASYKNK